MVLLRSGFVTFFTVVVLGICHKKKFSRVLLSLDMLRCFLVAHTVQEIAPIVQEVAKVAFFAQALPTMKFVVECGKKWLNVCLIGY
jgi:hypothetical protein